MKTLLVCLLAASAIVSFGRLSRAGGSPISDSDGSTIADQADEGTVQYGSAAVKTPHKKKPKPTPTPTPSPSATPIDSKLFTTYSLFFNNTQVNWSVCGSLPASTNCFSSGSLGPFGRIGALLEGSRTTDAASHTVVRDIYVLDTSSSGPTGVTLFVYKRTDTLSSSNDNVTVSLRTKVDLPLSPSTSVSMAANDNMIVIGSSLSPQAAIVRKSNFTVTQSGAFNPPLNVVAITTDTYGYITITFGSINNNKGTGFFVLDPSGQIVEADTGGEFMLNVDQAALPATIP